MDAADLPLVEFAFPGPLRDQLVAAILDGSKTSTTARVAEYEIENERLPQVGERGAVPDSSGRLVAIIEMTAVKSVRLADVDLQHVIDEGEGFDSIADWREGHTRFWDSTEMHEALGARLPVTDDTELVLQRFRVVEAL
jgi:uncharacterized protein YhfF